MSQWTLNLYNTDKDNTLKRWKTCRKKEAKLCEIEQDPGKMGSDRNDQPTRENGNNWRMKAGMFWKNIFSP